MESRRRAGAVRSKCLRQHPQAATASCLLKSEPEVGLEKINKEEPDVAAPMQARSKKKSPCLRLLRPYSRCARRFVEIRSPAKTST